jgi:hypothetical protein
VELRPRGEALRYPDARAPRALEDPRHRARLHVYDLLRGYPFTVLEEGERLLVSGLCGRIWTLARDYPQLDGPGDFHAWKEPTTVRVLIAHWAEPLTDGRAEIVSEARVAPVDRTAALRLRALWLVVGAFDHLVGAEGLTVAVRRAEAR